LTIAARSAWLPRHSTRLPPCPTPMAGVAEVRDGWTMADGRGENREVRMWWVPHNTRCDANTCRWLLRRGVARFRHRRGRVINTHNNLILHMHKILITISGME
jgi:hypothetical protein